MTHFIKSFLTFKENNVTLNQLLLTTKENSKISSVYFTIESFNTYRLLLGSSSSISSSIIFMEFIW